MKEIVVETTKNREVVDITDRVNTLLNKEKAEKGLCYLFLTHTTASLTTADLDPGTDLDMLNAFEKMIPKLSYRHPHDPSHVGDHIVSSMLGPSVVLPFKNKKLILGTWQRVVLVELNGPKSRRIVINLVSI